MRPQPFNRIPALVLIATIAIWLAGSAAASSAAGRKPDADAPTLAKAVLTPYLMAHAYKGTSTTTVVADKDKTHITTTTFIQARCDARGNVTRLRTQTTSWGQQDTTDVTGAQNREIAYDGQTLWVYRPDDQRYQRSPRKPPGLPDLLGLPPADAAWTFAPHRKDDLSDERALCAHSDAGDWTLILDATTGHLRRIEHSSGTGAQRTETITALRDLAFDDKADQPDILYAFHPPDGAQEDTAVVAQDVRPLLP
jgi:outer membrane lipoprotein-sorting protein